MGDEADDLVDRAELVVCPFCKTEIDEHGVCPACASEDGQQPLVWSPEYRTASARAQLAETIVVQDPRATLQPLDVGVPGFLARRGVQLMADPPPKSGDDPFSGIGQAAKSFIRRGWVQPGTQDKPRAEFSDPHGRFLMPSGKHRGQPITRVPVSYLLWMVNVGHAQTQAAQDELARRGTVKPACEISGHALDRFSQRFLKHWERNRRGDEGIHAYVVRLATECLGTGRVQSEVKFEHRGIKFVFKFEHEWPVLLSVM